MSAKIHLLVEQRNDVWIEGLPVGVFKVVFLTLQYVAISSKSETNGTSRIWERLADSFSKRSTIVKARGSWTSCITSQSMVSLSFL
jgi:hypothetical protein